MSSKGISEEFRTDEVVIRGVTYKFRELSADEYDEILKLAAGPDDQADLASVLKLMAQTCLIEPKLDAEALGKKPYPVYNKILQTVNHLHFSSEALDEQNPNS